MKSSKSKSTSKKWSVNTSRQVKIENGRFGTVVTKKQTKHFNFGNVYYISHPIPNDEFAETLELWKSDQSLSASSSSSSTWITADDDNGDDDPNYRPSSEDVWVHRSDSDNSQTYLKPIEEASDNSEHEVPFEKETVLQNTWKRNKNKYHGRPLPSIPKPNHTKPTQIDYPGRYDLPDDSWSVNSGTTSEHSDTSSCFPGSSTHSETSTETLETTGTRRFSSVADLTVLKSFHVDNDDEEDRTQLKIICHDEDLTNTHAKTKVSVLPKPAFNKQIDRGSRPEAAEKSEETKIKRLLMPTLSWSMLSDDNEYEDPPKVKPRRPPPPIPYGESVTRDGINSGSRNVLDELYEEPDGVPLQPRPNFVDPPLQQSPPSPLEDELYECPDDIPLPPPSPPPPPIPPREPKLNASLKPEILKGEIDEKKGKGDARMVSHVTVNEYEDPEEYDDCESSCPDMNSYVLSETNTEACEICNELPDLSHPELMKYHDDLHSLREKEEMLETRNKMDEICKQRRENINTLLAESLENRKSIYELEIKEKEYESELKSIGQHTQIDEYYAKSRETSRPNVRIRKMSPVNEDMPYAIPVKNANSTHVIETKFEKKWSFRSTFKASRKLSFSSKMYAADSGIGAE